MDVALRIAEEVENVDDICRTYANWVWILDVGGRLDEALAVGEEGVKVSEGLGLMRFFGAHLLCNMADYLYRLGRWDECEAAVRRAVDVGPLGINEILAAELLGRLAVARGRLEEAAEHLRPLAALAARAADVQFVAPVQVSLTELAIWEGRPADAAAQVAEAIRLIDFSPEVRVGEIYALGVRAAADLAEIARARRAPADEASAVKAGEDLLAAMRRRHDAVITTRPALEPVSTAWLRQCEAETTRSCAGRTPRCGSPAPRLGTPRPAVSGRYARWREAEARVAARGDREQAAATLRRALDTAERLGAAPVAREISGLARRARLSLDAPGEEAAPAETDTAADLGLTGREREVLALVALGRTNRQIAEELFISENTAGVHVSNIIGKLAVSSRGEAAAMAYRLGLVEA